MSKSTLRVNPALKVRAAVLATISPTPTLAVVSPRLIVPPLDRVKVTPTELVAATTPDWLLNPLTVATNVEALAALPVLRAIVRPFRVKVCTAPAVVSAMKPVSTTTVWLFLSAVALLSPELLLIALMTPSMVV